MKRIDSETDLQRLALSLSPNIGAKTLNNLLRHFDHNLAEIFAAPTSDLQKVPGVGKTIAREISQIDLRRIERDFASWHDKGVKVLMPEDEHYPELLRDLSDAPPVLFARGQLNAELWAKTIAIVGTREPSPEARFITLQLAMKLAQADYTLVSGMALGIDTAAHVSALTARGSTIAVLGSGVLNIYPESNRKLADQICQAGAVLSEVHPNSSANAQRLVSRNRIISGLAQAVVLVESQVNGGAMYSARFAKEQGRPVYTFDLPASGNQSLIKAGAITLKRDDPFDFLLG